MSYRFSDKSREARRWRGQQMAANLAISGRPLDPDFLAQLEAWEDEGLSQDQIAERIKAEHRALQK